MRLQLILLLAFLLATTLFTATARSDHRLGSWLSVYSDNDNLTVISPQLTGRVGVHENVSLDGAYDVDIISAATVDVVTAASPRGYDERRHGVTLGANWTPEARSSVGVSYLLSRERDYWSDGAALSGSREWLDRRLTTRLDTSVMFDQVGRAGEPRTGWNSLTTIGGAGTLSWIFDRWTVGDLSYELQSADGFQSSPYRYVALEWPGILPPGVSVPEAVPNARLRHALAARARRALGKLWFASLQYRLYFDDWGVVSHTAELEVHRAFARDKLLVSATARGYSQSAADFQRSSYSQNSRTIPEFRSVDKMLARSWSVLGGLRAELGLEPPGATRTIRAVGKIELYDQHFVRFAPLDARRALITSFGAVGEF